MKIKIEDKRWPIELITVISVFGIVLHFNNTLKSINSYNMIGGFILIILTCLIFLIFGFKRIFEISKKTKKPISNHFNKKLEFKHIWIIILVFIIGNSLYKLLMRVEFVNSFGFDKQWHYWQLSNAQSWIMAVLIVLYYPIVVFSEEIFFRSYLFEIQYIKFRNYTWIINGFSWSVYHIFSTTNFMAILPTCLLVSYVYQKKRNVWITIAIHFFNNFFALYPVFKSYLLRISY